MGGQRKRIAEGRQVASRDPLRLHILNKRDFWAGRCTKDDIGTYVEVEAQSPLVQEMFDLYESGATLDKIARSFNARGISTPRGKQWRATGIRDILRNPVYKGQATYGKTQRVTDESRLTRGFKNKTYQVLRPADQVTIIPCPVLVDAAQWERVNKRLDNARARHGGRKDRVFMLSGLLRCPKCGAVMRGHTLRANETRREHRYYACSQSRHAR